MSINLVVLTGNLASDAKVFENKTGSSISFTVACNYTKYNSETKQYDKAVDFIQCSKYSKDKQPKIVQYLKKGTGVEVKGKVSTYKTNQDGKDVYKTAILADSLDFAAGNSKSDNSSQSYDDNKETTGDDISLSDLAF